MKYMRAVDFMKTVGDFPYTLFGTMLKLYNVPIIMETFSLPITDETVKAYEEKYTLNPDEHVLLYTVLPEYELDAEQNADLIYVTVPKKPSQALAMIVKLPSFEELARLLHKTYNLKAFL